MGSSERALFAIRGLGCASCAFDVGRALRKLRGVLDANVNYMADRGFVEFDPAQTNWEILAKVLRARGYAVVPIPALGSHG